MRSIANGDCAVFNGKMNPSSLQLAKYKHKSEILSREVIGGALVKRYGANLPPSLLFISFYFVCAHL